MMYALRRLAIVWLFLFIIPGVAYAAGDFGETFDVQYAIAPSGTTIVTQNVVLTNQFTNYYPHKYSIVLDSSRIANVIAYDTKGVIHPEITQKDGKTEILLTFNDQIVGVGKKLQFTLRFENGDIAQKKGNVWEVNIPGITSDPDLESYSVSVAVPPSFGPAAYMSPLPADGRTWDKDQMIRGGISIAYGAKQAFDLRLSYFLENPNVTSAKGEIALPPDTQYQKVTVTALNPRPETVLEDPDGNWLAHYTLLPGQHLEIEANIHVVVQLTPTKTFTQGMTALEQYLKPTKYWESQQGTIVALARQYTTPRQIYNFVVQTLKYDYDRINQNPIRKGALQALATPQNSICMEFTDLFIAIARAAGIPARELVGYAHTTNSKLRPLSLVTDVLHAWPEYFDRERETWVPVDPTWGNTTGGVNYFDKLDFNHVVFAIHGIASDYPYPAGFYRKNAKEGKDVGVAFSTAVDDKPPGNLTTTIDFPTSVTAGTRVNGKVVVANETGTRMDQASISVQSTPVDVAVSKQLTDVLPFETIEVPVAMALPYSFQQKQGRISVTVNGQTIQHYFPIQPMYVLIVISVAVFLSAGSLLAFMIFQPKLWPRSHKK